MASEDNTQIVTKKGEVKESSIFGVSIRGWIAFVSIFAVCFVSTFPVFTLSIIAVIKQDPKIIIDYADYLTVKEPLYGVVYGVLGFYFAKMTMPKS